MSENVIIFGVFVVLPALAIICYTIFCIAEVIYR